MEAEIVHRRSEVAVKLVRFVYGDLENIDTCKLRGAFLFFLPVLLFKTVKFVLWDFWKSLLGISEGLFGFALGFTVASLLAGLSIGLWLADPVLLVEFRVIVVLALGVVCATIVTIIGTFRGNDYLKSPSGKKFLERAGHAIESTVHRVADSLPGKVLWFSLGIILFPVKVVVYYFLWKVMAKRLVWQLICRENSETLFGSLVLIWVFTFISVLIFFLISSLITDILATVILVSVLLFLVLVAIGIAKFPRSGMWRAMREGFGDFKDRVCRQVKLID